MEAAAAGTAGRIAKGFPADVWSACIAAAAIGACPGSWAQQAPPPRDAPLLLEVRSADVPRLDMADAPLSTSRLSLTVMPQARSAVGLSLGLNASNVPGIHSLAPDTQRRALDIGVLLRHTLQNQQHIDVMAWKRLQPEDAYTLAQMQQPTYGARVELNLAPARTGFVADRGFLGVQLQGGARITLKRKDGMPMVYYRTTF